MTCITETINSARRVGTPLISVSTPDDAATMKLITAALPPGVGVVQWDVISGVQARNELGVEAVSKMVGDTDNTVNNPTACAIAARKLPSNTVLFMEQCERWLSADQSGHKLAQAIWILRDLFKADFRTVIMLGKDLDKLPAELAGDTLQLDEPLPDKEAIREIITERVLASANRSIDRYNETHGQGESRPRIVVEPTQLAKSVDACLGLTAFQAEQFTAMALKPSGIQVSSLQERKEKQIARTPGLSVFRGGDTFEHIGGLKPVRDYLTALMTSGRRNFQGVVWLDEIEKTGLANTSDLSGVNSDAEGQILTYMEDHNVYAVMLVGVPGSGKSAISKAAGSTFDKWTIRFDLGGMKGSHVGESERYVREALKVTSAVTNDNGLWLATSNRISNLSAALRSRFSDVFFFDLPSQEEMAVIWNIWIRKFGLQDAGHKLPHSDGWVGRNIKKCCEKAFLLGTTLAEAAKTIIPVGQSAADDVEDLRKQANGRFLSASYEGVYRMSSKVVKSTKRSVSVEPSDN